MTVSEGVRPNRKVIRGYRPLSPKEAVWMAYELKRPKSINTRNNFKVAVREIEYVLTFKCKLKYMQNYKQKHSKAIIDYWRSQGISDHTLANKTASLRKILNECGKKSCVLKNKDYGIRRYETKYRDKRWTVNGKGDLAKIKMIDPGCYKHAEKFIHALQAERILGLRKREALLMVPGEQIFFKDKNPYMFIVTKGSKNGRAREIRITNHQQAELLNHLFNHHKEGLLPEKMSYKKVQRSYYYFLKINGLKDGHGLRQAYANERYIVLLKEYAHLGSEKEIRKAAYSVLTRELGHNRTSVLKYYLKNYVAV